MDETTKKEQDWHNKRFSEAKDPRNALGKYYSVTVNAKKYLDDELRNYSDNLKLLEYGCGTGGNLEFYNTLGFKIYGIDISEEGIKKAIQNAKIKKIQAEYFVDDAHSTHFDGSEFDVIVGNGIIHHLDIEQSMVEINRLLKNKGGKALFFEPMGHNPSINLYRKLTPKMRTIDERPLTTNDFLIMKKYFNVDVKHFCFLSIGAVFFHKSKMFSLIYNALEKLDSIIFTIFPFMKKYSWIVVISLMKKV